MEQDYFLGLDMGTGSLGWAVTNDQYQVLRHHGGEFVYLKVPIQQKKEECIGRRVVILIAVDGEYNFFRSYLQRKSVKLIRVSIFV